MDVVHTKGRLSGIEPVQRVFAPPELSVSGVGLVRVSKLTFFYYSSRLGVPLWHLRERFPRFYGTVSGAYLIFLVPDT